MTIRFHGQSDGATFVFKMGRRELWLYGKLASPGINHIAVVSDEEGSQFYLNGKKIAYLHKDPMQPSVFLVPMPHEWVKELTEIDIEELKVRGSSN